MRDPWIDAVCWHNEKYLSGPVRGVVVSFHGLGGCYREEASSLDLALARENILVVAPYYGQASWMNRAARQFVDELLARVWQDRGFPDGMPLAAQGSSMGGAAALLYCRYGKRRPIGCDAAQPVCNTVLHFSERPDTASSLYLAYYGYPEPFDEVLREHSPLHQVKHMPDIPYFFSHGDADRSVNKVLHSDAMVKALRGLGRRVEYLEVPGMGHGVNVPLEVLEKRRDFLTGLFR